MIRGKLHAALTRPKVVGLSESSKTCHAMATKKMPSPSRETVNPVHSRAKSRMRNGRSTPMRPCLVGIGSRGGCGSDDGPRTGSDKMLLARMEVAGAAWRPRRMDVYKLPVHALGEGGRESSVDGEIRRRSFRESAGVSSRGRGVLMGFMFLIIIGQSAAIVYLLVRDESPAPASASDPVRSEPSEEPDLSASPVLQGPKHTNEKGGFRFSYPEDWDVAAQGSRSEATSADGNIRIEVSAVAATPIDRLADLTLERLRRQYDKLSLRSRTQRAIGDLSSLIVRGTVEEKKGALRFVMGSIGGQGRSFLVLAFAEFPAANTLEVSTSVQHVLGSFEALPQPSASKSNKPKETKKPRKRSPSPTNG